MPHLIVIRVEHLIKVHQFRFRTVCSERINDVSSMRQRRVATCHVEVIL